MEPKKRLRKPAEVDIPLDPGTVAAAKGMLSHLKTLAESNTLIRGWIGEHSDSPPAPQYVTLSQMAAIVSRSKRTLERAKTSGSLPTPDVEGGGGSPDEWRWDHIRPWLEDNYRKGLPERFPTQCR